MIHEETMTVRWHDTTATREVSPSGCLMLMQEAANLQFARNGMPLDTLRDRDGIAFLISRIALDFPAPLFAYDAVRALTYTAGGHGVGFYRGFELWRGNVLAARGQSVWALIRLSDRSLLPFTEAPMRFGDEALTPTETPLRFRVPRDTPFEVVGTRRIAFSDLDYNLHMNNTRYPDMICDFLPDPLGCRVRGISVSYCREATFGDELTVERAPAEGGFLFRARKGNVVCAEALVRTEPR